VGKQSKEFEWNLGVSRVEFIGELVNGVRTQYGKARKTTDMEEVVQYFIMTEMLYDEIRTYLMDKKEKQEEITNFTIDGEDYEKLSELDEEIDKWRSLIETNDATAEQFLGKIHEFERQLQEKRVSLGLDIPTSTSYEQGSTMASGRFG